MEFEGAKFCDKETINKCNNVIDSNFEYFVQYQDDCLKKNSITSIRSYRSIVLDFLTSELMKATTLRDVTQEQVEEYIISFLGKYSDSNYNTRISCLMQFFKFHKSIMRFNIDISGLRIKKAEIVTSESNKTIALSAKQVSQCRELYKNDLEKLFIFEMLYGTDIDDKALKRLRYANFDSTDNSFKLKNKKIYVSDSIAKLVDELKESKVLNQSYDVVWIIEGMKADFKKLGVENLKIKDIQETRKKLCWRCPQCGEYFEAVADNWCACKYTEEGKYWIVCKENCGRIE